MITKKNDHIAQSTDGFLPFKKLLHI